MGWWIVGFAVIVGLYVLYLSQTAARLDRLHHRVDTSRAAMHAQFQNRANEVLNLASSGRLDPAASVLLADAADRELDTAGGIGTGFPPERIAAENVLTEALRAAFSDRAAIDEVLEQPGGPEVVDHLASALQKAVWSHRFYGDAVRSSQQLRRQRLVQLFRLAGTAPMPQGIEFNDEVPDGLRGR